MDILNIIVGFILGVLAVIVAFPEGREWTKSRLHQIILLNDRAKNSIANFPSILAKYAYQTFELIAITAVLALGALFLLFVCYLTIPPVKDVFKIITEKATPNIDDIYTLALMAGVTFFAILFIIMLLWFQISKVNSKITSLYQLEAITNMINNHNQVILDLFIADWDNIVKDIIDKGSVPHDLAECKPELFENGILFIKCPNKAMADYLQENRGRTRSRLDNYLKLKQKHKKIYFNISEVRFTNN